MKTARPSAERLLARFDNLHLLVERTEEGLKGELVEPLTPLQRRILALLGVPEHVYDLSFLRPPPGNSYTCHNISEKGVIDVLIIRTPEGVERHITNLSDLHRRILHLLGPAVEKCYLGPT